MMAHQSTDNPHQSYDARYFERLFAVEDRHFWFKSRNQVIATLVAGIVPEFRPGYRVLEVGCGTGNTLRVLERVCSQGRILGMDLFYEGLSFARRRVACPLIQADMNCPPFASSFDLVGMFDVLEHLPDDRAVLRDILGFLRPGGQLLLTVPAHMALWSYFDEAAHHCRRYETAELRNKLLEAGYQIEYLTPYMASLYPLVWLGRRLAKLLSRATDHDGQEAHELVQRELKINPVLNNALSLVLAVERRRLARRRLIPTGTSLLALARRD
jgi:SAM-dependent methyltransferase